jgi:phenylacetate-CoA ligase
MLAFLNRNLFQPLLARRAGSRHLRYLRELERTQFDDPEVIRARQTLAVKRLLTHAYETVPFYRDRFDRVGFRPGDFRSLEDLEAIPVLTKQDIRKSSADLVSEKYLGKKLFLKKTSGSTGVPLEIQINPESMQWKAACTLRSDQWSGWRRGTRVAKVWGNPEYKQQGWKGRLRNRFVDRAVYLDTLHLDDGRIGEFIDTLRRHRPGLIFGHAHSLYLVACHVKKTCPGAIRPDGIISTAMILHDWQREVIETAFGCKVTNRYGCEEVSLIACECERHDGLHVNADGVYVEVLCDGRPARPGEAGSIVVTDLVNRAQPILRYQVGDVAVFSERRCPCGRGLPLLERLEGREADYVVTASGELVSGISLTENFALHVPGVAQLQIVQEAVDRFRFRVVRGPDFGPASVRRIGELVTERFGPEAQFECEYVERIPQEPSGKYRFCISHVPNPFTRSREAVVA